MKYLDSRLVTGVRKEKVISSRAEYYCYPPRTLLCTPLFLVEQRYSVTMMSNCIPGIQQSNYPTYNQHQFNKLTSYKYHQKKPPIMKYTRANLLTPARNLCSAFSSSSSIPTLLTNFTHDPYPQAHEHGLPHLAPFLGRTFTGTDGVSRYFEVMGSELGFEDMSFEPEAEWLVDTSTMAVVIRGTAKFFAKRTGQKWDEGFVYRLGIAEEVNGEVGGRGQLKVQEYEVWADTGAAYLAIKGRLGEVLGGEIEAGTGGTGRTRKSQDRKRSGCGEVVGSGMSAYGSCGQ